MRFLTWGRIKDLPFDFLAASDEDWAVVLAPLGEGRYQLLGGILRRWALALTVRSSAGRRTSLL